MKLHLPRFSFRIRPEKLAYYGLLGAVVLVVGSFAIWRIVSYFSPQQNSSGCTGGTPDICTRVILRTSDYSEPANTCPGGGTRLSLPNSIDDRTVPCYADNALNATTLLTGNANSITLFRLEGQAAYK